MANSDYVIDVTEATFQAEVLERSRRTPVVVDFWAPWCGPCRMLGPVLEKLANEFKGGFILAKINTDENQRIAMHFGIQGIPAVKGFRDGRVAAEFVGAQPEPQVRAFLQKLDVKVGSGSAVAAGPDPDALLAEGKWVEAEMALRQMGATNGAAPAVKLSLARALLAQGKAAEAGELLDNVEEGPEAAQALALRPLAALLLESTGQTNGAGGLDGLYHAGRAKDRDGRPAGRHGRAARRATQGQEVPQRRSAAGHARPFSPCLATKARWCESTVGKLASVLF